MDIWPMRRPVLGPAPAWIISSSVWSVPSKSTQAAPRNLALGEGGRHHRAAWDVVQRAAPPAESGEAKRLAVLRR
jgi:hypothetical protein